MVPYLHVTTHLDDRLHESLFGEKGGRGFPTLKFMDAEGEIIGEPNGRDVESFETTLTKLMVVKKLQDRIADGEKGLEDDLFLARLRIGAIPFEEAKAQAASFKDFTKEQQKEVAQLLVNAEVDSITTAIDSPAAAKEARGKFLAMLEANRIPTGDASGSFWSSIMEHAKEQADVALFSRALEALRAQFGGNEQAKSFFDAQQAVLETMKADAKVDS